MDAFSTRDTDAVIDLETGTKEVTNEHIGGRNIASGREHPARAMNNVRSGIISIDGGAKGEEALRTGNGGVLDSVELSPSRVEGEENVGLLESKASVEKSKKKKAAKPPRPPRSPSLDLDDQKLMRELAELAALKRARIERMKKRMKNAKLASPSNNNNFFALIITVLFCIVIIWQGVFARDNTGIKFHGSPEAAVQTRDGLISIQFYKNSSKLAPDTSQSASPNNVMPMPTLLG